MAGLGPATHDFLAGHAVKAWMAGAIRLADSPDMIGDG
jgi:hypothetical protein